MVDCCQHPENVDLTPDARDEALATYARALAHPARVKLVRQIAGRRECISAELVESVGLAQSTVSEHLRILRKAGVIEAEARPPRTCFRLKSDALPRLRDLLGEL